jgi:hypothetical protein
MSAGNVRLAGNGTSTAVAEAGFARMNAGIGLGAMRWPIMTNSDNFHRDAIWNDNDLIFRRRVVASIVPDSKWPQMWRVSLPNGQLSDMVNLSRARDAARSLALKALIEGPVAAPPMRSLLEAAE